jgi:hypothetical protein
MDVLRLSSRCPVAFLAATRPQRVQGFQNIRRNNKSRKALSICAEASSSSPLEGLINGITVFLNNSPINAGKKALAIAQAGDYDVVATKAKLDKLIADNPVRESTCSF